ncbi:MAG TPA: methylated-DNA--[protein]-cysteine S-methyltransferase [Thiotrichales bacterium]|nr:methylated-DNA--[protein]-cysteine S-methyltransferase [Thiotrichales bacterium]
MTPWAATFPLPRLTLGVRIAEGRLAELALLPLETEVVRPRGRLAREVVEWLQRWLDDPFLPVGLPLGGDGSPFQRRVWSALREIPPGRVLTYGELARDLGSSPRAVGGACRTNPLPIVVPCHRVVSASGIGGYAGAVAGPRVAFKQWLLEREGCL